MKLADHTVDLHDWRFRVYPIGDMHLTLRTFDEARFRKYIKTIQDDPAAVAVVMGDISDARSRDHRFFAPEMVHPRFHIEDLDILEDKAAEYAAGLLAPIAGKIAGVIRGNHHQAAFTHSLRRILRYEADANPPDLGDRGMIRVRAHSGSGRKGAAATYVVFAQHHTSGSRLPGAQINQQLQTSPSFDADLYLFAHSHRATEYTQPRYVMRRSGKLELVRRDMHFLTANAWLRPMALNANSYADEKALPLQSDRVYFADVKVASNGGLVRTTPRVWEG